eukprot:COSAG05_NODE_3024_length_2409_cov_1.401299_1_plen_285_part_10
MHVGGTGPTELESLPDALLLLILERAPSCRRLGMENRAPGESALKRLSQFPTLPCRAVLDAKRFCSMWDPTLEAQIKLPLPDIHILPLAARCSALLSIDLSTGCFISGSHAAELVRCNPLLQAFRAPRFWAVPSHAEGRRAFGPAFAAEPLHTSLLQALSKCQCLSSLCLERTSITDQALIGMASMAQAAAERDEGGGFSALQQLSLSFCHNLVGTPVMRAPSSDTGVAQHNGSGIATLAPSLCWPFTTLVLALPKLTTLSLDGLGQAGWCAPPINHTPPLSLPH